MLLHLSDLAFGALAILLVATPARALDQEHWSGANAAIEKGIAFLRGTQQEDGSWSPDPGPAVTGLVVAAMLDRPAITATDPAVEKGLAYILSKVRDDGSIHDGILANYNTSICLSGLSRVNNRPAVAEVIARGENFLRTIQWFGQTGPQGKIVDQKHPFYGGFGYGKHGRPDGSNTQFAVQALYDLGLDCDDMAFQRAVIFCHRLQGIESNDLHAERITLDGGAIYATSISKDLVGVPQSMASPEMIEQAKRGQPVSQLRTYGSMTYAMFKTYVYALLNRDDPRVVNAFEWIRRNYTLEQNPGMPEPHKFQGYYYYLLAFGRALDAWGSTHIFTADGKKHDWANDLIDKLVALQRKDGSWVNEADRWYEGDPNLVTAYAITALNHAIR